MPFHCGLTEDYREVVKNIRNRFPTSPLLGLSFSMGANIMTKYIGEEGNGCPLSAGIIVGCPYDMYKVIKHLDSQRFTFSRFYDLAILNFLKNAFKDNQDQILKIPVGMDVKKISNSTGIMEFTEEMTRKAFGYKSAKDLLDYSSCKNYMDDIKIPVLFLNSLDDPICIKSLIPFEKFVNNPNIVLALTENGGHIGYMGGTWPTSWIEHPVIEFFESALKHYGSKK
ncbi:medium-chain fatty acid ethyl ester synthase/esterase 2 [Coemansia sp. RSA 1813]|nr:medium-chain fatty acid ethyl ester synthase/esterase 2 [Coemansia sp. RSA 1843]KAJ2214053.1 medium-chain fatty acid ethyl ester synthase/esterase 2 [Coemansia sp. RSA 487]KAJ2566793.1 medium-chain fatty acid ethyl ester synthase/esterase 2 [Coemansia sp. RSA 1813]